MKLHEFNTVLYKKVRYILYSLKTGKSYVGYTSHLFERIKSHNVYGNDWTKDFRPWMIIHVEFYESKSEAMKREKYLKAGGGLYLKRKLIEDFLTRN